MPRISLTDLWSFEIDDNFDRNVVEECLVFSQARQLVMSPYSDLEDFEDDEDEDFDYELLPRRSIWVLVYYVDEDPAVTLEWIKSLLPEHPDRVFESDRDNLLRYAYLMPTGDPDREYWELTTFCIARSSFARISYNFDELDLLEWALAVWKSTTFDVTGRAENK
jgi:hypothetical protein